MRLPPGDRAAAVADAESGASAEATPRHTYPVQPAPRSCEESRRE